MAHISLPMPSQFETKEPEIGNNDTKIIRSLDLERRVDAFGSRPFVEAILLALAAFFESPQSLISVYADAVPTWHCTDNKVCNSSSSNICELPKSSWAWDGISKTIISEWGLECSSSFIRGLPAFSHFVGCLFGVSAVSSLGSKNLLFLTCLIMSITTYLTIFSGNVWVYSLLRFLSGLGRASIATCTIGHGLLDSLFLLVGTLSLPTIAFINPSYSWRNIYLWTSIPAFIYTAILVLFVPDENGLAQLKDMTEPMSLNLLGESRVNLFSFIKDLFQRRLASFMLCFAVGSGCYLVEWRIGTLGFDIYMSNELSILLYITSFLICDLWIKRWNWISPLLLLLLFPFLPIGTMICSSMSASVIIGINSERINIGRQLLDFLSVCVACNGVMICVIESIGTCVSNSAATLMKRQAVTFGVVFTSVLVAAGNVNKYAVLGLFLVCFVLFMSNLPNDSAPRDDTRDEEEQN